jgi:hypothetical protein
MRYVQDGQLMGDVVGWIIEVLHFRVYPHAGGYPQAQQLGYKSGLGS